MALGFFKKNNTADLILKNGRVLTQCADLPQAEAVACKDGRIIAVGDSQELEALAGSSTRVIDLEGRYAVPGFISLWEEPVLSAFDGCYLKLDGCTTKEELLERMRVWQTFHPQEDILFGYGYNEALFDQGAPAFSQQYFLPLQYAGAGNSPADGGGGNGQIHHHSVCFKSAAAF